MLSKAETVGMTVIRLGLGENSLRLLMRGWLEGVLRLRLSFACREAQSSLRMTEFLQATKFLRTEFLIIYWQVLDWIRKKGGV